MDMQSLILLLVVGGLAGWLAGNLMKGRGFGLIGNIVVGIVGAVLGGFVLNFLGIVATGLIGLILTATIGAIILVFVIGLIRRA
ncbi:GlsB/YeaQ/YmgE family stress response membrane protein [Thiomicrospira pelophila]|uniref:GlsB/YeaQ/YmgE family stress response membrane protein n=1 Tax=Thiomicrospira pelophila TaxID=934 RepID=UPI0004A6FA4D|nr:GlsB/YeaQ/YmgE family stress response membrane protein [Thiomicrospira pelophila]